jgi:phosphoribosylaminoimidazole carboxylase (NCAIR synthetase)
MTLNEQVLQCARDSGYDGKGTNVIRAKYNSGEDMGEWWIENGIIRRRVTDEDFKQWKRNYKLNQLLSNCHIK